MVPAVCVSCLPTVVVKQSLSTISCTSLHCLPVLILPAACMYCLPTVRLTYPVRLPAYHVLYVTCLMYRSCLICPPTAYDRLPGLYEQNELLTSLPVTISPAACKATWSTHCVNQQHIVPVSNHFRGILPTVLSHRPRICISR